MIKKNKSMMVIGSTIVAVISILLVYVLLISTGVIVGREYTIIFEAVNVEKVYDGTPLNAEGYRISVGQDIIDAHKLEPRVTIQYSDGYNGVDVGIHDITLHVELYDENNAEVTSKYNIITSNATATITPRPIMVQTKSQVFMYDGVRHSVDEIENPFSYDETGFLKGHNATLRCSGSRAEIGSTYVDVSFEIYDEDGNLINPSNYEIIYEGERGVIEVRPRYIYAIGHDISNFYNGNYQYINNQEYDEARSELLPGHRIIDIKNNFEEINAGEYSLDDITFHVVDSTGKDVTNLYTIDPNSDFGSYFIEKIPLTIDTASFPITKIYDGTAVEVDDDHYFIRNSIQIPSNETAVVEFTTEDGEPLVNVGQKQNIAILTIKNEKGEETTDNYEITTDYGTLTVLSREVTLKTLSHDKVFDGLPLIGSEVVGVDGLNYEIVSGSIPSIHELKVELNAVIVEGGSTVDNTIDRYYVIDKNNGNLDVTSNYNFTIDTGLLQIYKAQISIITEGNSWPYDGLEHVHELANCQGLPNDCTIEYYNYPKVIDATYDKETGNLVPVDNKPNIIIRNKKGEVIYDDANGTTNNFEVVSAIYGKLTVTPLDITITTGSNSKTYDGTPCMDHLFDVVGKRTTDVIQVSWPNDITEVQRDDFDKVVGVENKPTVVIFDKNNKNVTDNYRIQFVCGTLTVTPVTLAVSTMDYTKLYDGLPIVVGEDLYNINCQFVGNDHIANLTTVADYVNVIIRNGVVGTIPNEINFNVENEYGQDVTHNYDIVNIKTGVLKIEPIELVLKTIGGEVSYDGNEHLFDYDWTLTPVDYGTELPNYLGYEVNGFEPFVNVKANNRSYLNSCNIVFYHKEGLITSTEMEKNIKLTKEFGEVYIRPITIDVEVKELVKDYDGKPFEYLGNNDDWFEVVGIKNFRGIPCSLPAGQEIQFDDAKAYNKIDAGTYKNEMTIKVVSNEMDNTSNYNVNYLNRENKIIINKVTLTFVTDESSSDFNYIYSKTYDGTTLYGGTLYLRNEDLDKFSSDWSYEVYEDYGIVDVQWTGSKVKTEKNSDVIKIKNILKNNDITKNFNVIVEGGYLEIQPIAIEFQASKSKNYVDKIVKEPYHFGAVLVDNEIYLAQNYKDILNSFSANINVVEYTEATKVTDKPITNKITVEIISGTKNITKNFTITQIESFLQFETKEIILYTKLTKYAPGNIYQKVYDGLPLNDYELEFDAHDRVKLEEMGVNIDDIEIVSYTEITNVYRNSNGDVKSVPNKIEIIIRDSQGNNITDVFDINYDHLGELKINPVELTIQNSSISEKDKLYYDGLEHWSDDLTVSKGAASLLLNGWTYEITPNLDENDKFIEAGKYTNNVDYDLVIKNSQGEELSLSNFKVETKTGDIVILPKEIYIYVQDARKPFDNIPLTSDAFEYANEEEAFLAEMNHTLNISFFGSQLYVGSCENDFDYVVIDNESSAEVTNNYKVIKLLTKKDWKGKLQVDPLVLTAVSSSATKIYDGTELVAHSLVKDLELLDGFTYEVEYLGSQTEIGTSMNDFVVTIYDSEEKSLEDDSIYTGCIIVMHNPGKLEVIPYVTGTGNLNTDRPNPDENKTSLVINVNSDGIIYLRDRSYGDYLETGWAYATPYSNIDYDLNPNMILSKILEENPILAAKKTIEITISENMPYLVPYYSADFEVNPDDTHISAPHNESEPYIIDYYLYNYNLYNYGLVDEEYKAFEEEYYDYVSKKYLTISDTLKKSLLAKGAQQGFKLEDKDLIVKIANYIQSFEYNTFTKNIDADIIEMFFKNNGGICQDFASAAVMMYRAYGIPARFVTGFVYNVSPEEVNTDISVTQNYAHAWVEIYIEGMGWVNVEVTPGIDSNISDGGPTTDERPGKNDQDKEQSSKPTGRELFKIFSEKAGNFYLRNKSYGNYNGSGFDDVVNPYLDGFYNPLQYSGNALSKYHQGNITFDMTSGAYPYYLLPYYSVGDYKEFGDDFVNGDLSERYTIPFYYYEIEDFNNYPQIPDILSTYELEYRQYVNDTYLSLEGVSSELYNTLLQIIDDNDLDSNDPNIIIKVKDFMRSFGAYDIDYSVSYDEETDVVLAFLTKYQEGVCRHYARTATLLYRALGIPARYTTGVLAPVGMNQTEKWINITDKQGHAWVEVYLDGFGWCPVEVTAGALDDDYQVDGEKPDLPSGSDAIKVTLYPKTESIKYQPEMDEVLLSNIVMSQTLIKQGYKVVGTIAPVENTVGIHQTYIESYTILDKEDNDVTNLFDVKLNPGKLTIYYEQISISVGSASKEYDGTPLVNEVITKYDIENLMPGHHINPTIIFTSQGRIEIGQELNDIVRTNLVLDSEDNDVTYMYDVVINTGTLTIVKRDLVILGGSYDFEEELDYPGQKLYFKEYEIIEGSLLHGHKIVSFEMTEDSYVNDENSGAENLVDISSIVIEDSEGNDVTKYYNIICEPGEIYYLG